MTKETIEQLVKNHVDKRLLTLRARYEQQFLREAEIKVKRVMDYAGDHIDQLTASYLGITDSPTLIGWERYCNNLNNVRIASPSKGSQTKESVATLTSKEKFILLILKEHEDHDGTCRIRVEELVEESGYSKKTVISSTSLLAKKGFIEKTRTGRQTTYRILQKRS